MVEEAANKGHNRRLFGDSLSTETGIDILILAGDLMEIIKRPVIAVIGVHNLDKITSQSIVQVTEEPTIPQGWR